MAAIPLQTIIDARIAAAGAGATSLNGLTDVDTATVAPTNGQALVWDGSQWEPGAVASSSGITSINGDTGTAGAVTLDYGDLMSVLTVTAYDATAGTWSGTNASGAVSGSEPLAIDTYSHIIFEMSDGGVPGDGSMTGVELVWPSGPHSVVITVKQADDGSTNNTLTFASSQVDRWTGGQAPVIDTGLNGRTTFVLEKYANTSGNGSGLTINGFHGQQTRSWVWAYPTSESAVLNAKAPRVKVTRPHRLISASITAETAPTGATLITDINRIEAGTPTSVWNSTPANRLTLAISGTSADGGAFDSSGVGAANVYYQPVIEQIGSTVAGAGVAVQLDWIEA
jgi:hypothetical protein